MLTSALIGTIKVANADNQSSDTNSWPMFRGDLGHSGYSASTSPSTNKTLWTQQTGGAVFSSPSVSEGVVYVSSGDGNLYALDATYGSQLWRSQIGCFNTLSSPAIANGVLYVGSDGGNIFALNQTTGVEIWTYSITGQRVDYSSPTVSDGIIYIGSYSYTYNDNYTTINYDGYLNALNASDGRLVWQDHIGAVVSSQAVVNGVVYAGSMSGNASRGSVFALNAANGAQIWSVQTEAVVSSPAVVNNVVYIASINGTVYALNSLTGNKVWNYQTNEQIMGSPAISSGVVYIDGLSNNDHALFALDAYTGNQLWTSPVGAAFSSPTVADGVVFVGSTDGAVYAVNDSTGSTVWSYHSSSHAYVYSSPCVVEGVVYIGSADGNVYAISDQGRYPTSTSVVCLPNPSNVGSSVACTATVSGSNLTGNVTWSSSSNTGTFSSTQTYLSSGNSTVIYTDQNMNEVTITASYNGDPNNLPSSSSTNLALTPNGNFTFLISPTSNTTITPYSNVSFNATVIDSNGTSWDVTNQTNWSISPNDSGYMYNNVFLAYYPGNFMVTGTYLDSNSSTSLTVVSSTYPPPVQYGDPTSISITSDNSVMLGNQTTAFWVFAHDSFGNSWFVSSDVNWTISADAGGSWSGNVYTSANIGDWTVTATYSGFQATVPLQVVNPIGLSIEPISYSMLPGGSETFKAFGRDPSGRDWDVTSEVNWSISGDAGGFWSGNVYTSANVGNWTVTGTYLGFVTTAKLSVLDPILLPKISFNTPSVALAQLNQTFTLNLLISNVQSLWGWAVNVSWDSAYLKLISVHEGDFLTSQVQSTFFSFARGSYRNSTYQFVELFDAVSSSTDGIVQDSASGSGVLATITFQIVNQTQSTPVTLSIENLLGPVKNAVRGDETSGTNPSIPISNSTFTTTVSVITPQWTAVDFYHVNKVDANDFFYFVDAYIHFNQLNSTLDPACDLNHDSKIDTNDFFLFLGDYVAYGQSLSTNGG